MPASGAPEFDWQDGGAGFIEAGRKRLEFQCHGPKPDDAPTIVMLHEGLGCVALWRDFPKRLVEATGMGVFVYSRAGYGQSDVADLPRAIEYMTQEAVEVLPQVLDGIGFRRGILFGHSDGATIAAIHAGSIEDFRVRGMVLIAPHFFAERAGLDEIKQARAVYETTDMREKMARYHKDPDCAFRGWNDAWLNPGFADWTVADVIDYLRVPVLAVQGEDDQYGTLAQIEVLQERSYAPVEELILAECRHAPQMEQPQAVLDGVAEFAARLWRIEAAQVIPV